MLDLPWQINRISVDWPMWVIARVISADTISTRTRTRTSAQHTYTENESELKQVLIPNSTASTKCLDVLRIGVINEVRISFSALL